MEHLLLFATLIHALRVVVSLERDFFESVVIPAEIVVAVDESIYMKIKNPLERQTECAFKAPDGNTFVQFSDDKCGIRIEKVQRYHAGVWKLKSTFRNSTYETSIKGISVVRVKERAKAPPLDNRAFSGGEDFAPSGVDLNYCYVSKTVGATKLSDIEKMKCSIPTGLGSDFAYGLWNVLVGVEGESREVSFSVNIQSMDETIETSVKRFDNDHMQLLCRVKNLKNILKFCRFERLDDDDFGLNLEDGIASSNYRYFGQGLVYGDCGLEIKPLRDLDRMQWRCFVGLMDADDVMKNIPEASKRIYKHSALLDASDAWNKLQVLDVASKELFFVHNETAVVECRANNPFDYCWFQHPSGRLFSLSDRKPLSEDDEFQYHGEGFHMAQCGLKIKLTFDDAGKWKCGMGRASDSMKEAVKTMMIDVKENAMMAVTKQIEDFSRNSAVVQCRAIPVGSSLASCHFLTPTGEAFSLNEKTTETNAIDGVFYFDPNRKLSDGFCAVVIKRLVKSEHAGKWICSGRILGRDEDSYDTVYVTIDGLKGASFSYLSLAIVLPLIVISAAATFGFKTYRKWKERQQVRAERLDEISMHTISSTGTEATTSSEDSMATSHSA